MIGLVLAVLFLGGLFALDHFYPRVSNSGQAANEIQRGFTGQTMIGAWALACGPAPAGGAASKAAIPFSLNPNPRSAAAVAAAQGRCSVTFRGTRKDKAVVLLVNFRLAGPAQNLAMVVLFPPFVKKDDIVEMRLGRGGLKLTVRACGKGACVVSGLVPPEAQALILSAPRALLVFPVMRDGKPVGMAVPFDGLKPAVDAMRRAES